MPKYIMDFRAEIEAPDQREALKCATRIEDAVACDEVLMNTGDYVKSFDLSGYDLHEEDQDFWDESN